MHKKLLLPILSIFLACSSGYAQYSKYILYQGDTLQGFDLQATYTEALANKVDAADLRGYIGNKERDFVRQKYHISVPTSRQVKQTIPVNPNVLTTCNNVNFEDGVFTPWTGSTGYNSNSKSALTVATAAISTSGPNSAETSCSYQTLVNTGTDPYANLPMVDPGGGTWACRLGGEYVNTAIGICSTQDPLGLNSSGEILQQTFPVTTANAMFTYSYLAVLEQTGGTPHSATQCPYFRVQVLDHNGDTIPCFQYYVEATGNTAPPGMLTSSSISNSNGTPVFYSPWTTNSLDLRTYIGTNVTVIFTAAGCTQGGHFGYAYIDAKCGPTQILASSPPVCLGGTVSLTAPAAITGSTYTWNTMPSGTAGITGSTTGQTVTINASGTYQVTVKQRPGCSYVIDTTINFFPNPLVTLASTNPTCNPGHNGTATATATTGDTPYTYSWSPAPGAGQGTANATGLNAGTYTITVTTTDGCKVTGTTTLTASAPPPTTTLTSTPATCSPGHDGTATATVTGGTGPFTYTWSPAPGGGQGTTAATGLNGGTYTFVVNGPVGTCSDTTTVVVSTPNGPTSTPATTPVSCFGGSDGTATVNVAAGTPAYTYSWNAPATGTTSTSTGLPAGTYTCSITDSKGCPITQVVTVTQPTALATTNTQVNVLCNGGNNGSITVTPTGGTAPYTYSWSPAPAAGTAATAGTLTAATYTCTITDAKGCTTTSTATITQPTPVTSTTSNTPALCGAANGSATVTAAGGTPGYTYTWAPVPTAGQGTVTASSIGAGTYTCTIKDANGCTIAPTVVVTNTGGPTTTMGPVTNVTCFGLCNGSVTATATGGTAPLTYSWTPAPGAGQGTLTASSLCPGTYTITTTDSHGCSTSATATITQPTAITVGVTSTNVSCFGKSDGTATASVTGGTPGYTYTWAPAPTGGQGTLNATGLPAGAFTFTVTDANGCTQTGTTTVTQPTLLTVSTAGINATCFGVCNGQLICIPAGGTPTYTYSWNTGCVAASCNNICPGTYTSTVTDSHGCIASGTATVTEPTAIVLTMFPKPSHCNHSDGSDSVFATGGTPGYTYTWKPTVPTITTSGLHGVPANTYTVVVHDSQGCADSMNNVVPNLPGVTLTVASTRNILCFGGNDGEATVTAGGGTKPYTYSWSPAPASGTLDSANNLTAGTYTAYLTDSTQCQNQVTFTITQPPPLTLVAMPPVTICIGQCTPLTATAGGGSPGYVYSWTLNGTPVTSPVCPVVTTTYTVTCTDSHGCVGAPATVVITVYPPLEVVTPAGKSVCPGACDTLNAVGTGGNGHYSYLWIPPAGLSNPNIANPVACPVATTTYTVIVSDNCGTPTDSAFETVTVYPDPVVTFTTTDTVKCAPMCASFVGASNPACASAVWQFGDGSTATGCNNARHCYMTAGTYNVTYSIIDIHGCPGSLTIPNFINALAPPVAAFTDAPNPASILSPTVQFTDLSTNAVGWTWVFGDQTDSVSFHENPGHTYLDTGCYTVKLVVVAADGCKDSTTGPVCIQPDFTFYAPNTFTPNGDGKNDVWMPFGIGIDPNHYDLMMFDRWGNLMFETHTWGEGWDGRANGGSNIAQIDTYVWKVKLLDFRGNHHEYEGHCNLIK